MTERTNCRRGACQVRLGDTYGIHRDTREHYCLSCGRKINAACGQEIVSVAGKTEPKTVPQVESERSES